MSAETRGSSLYSRIPAKSLAAVLRKASFHILHRHRAGSSRATRSVIDPSGTGTCRALPSRFSFDGWQDEPVRLGGAGRRGDDVDGRGPVSPALLVHTWSTSTLIAGLGVDGGDEALLYTEAVVQNLDHGRQAVGGARTRW